MSDGLGYLSHYLRDEPYAVGASLTTADCALVPHVFFFPGLVAAALGCDDLISRHERVAEYQRRVQEEPVVLKLLTEMRTALASSRLKVLVE
jgi:glutathione S-transferase